MIRVSCTVRAALFGLEDRCQQATSCRGIQHPHAGITPSVQCRQALPPCPRAARPPLAAARILLAEVSRKRRQRPREQISQQIGILNAAVNASMAPPPQQRCADLLSYQSENPAATSRPDQWPPQPRVQPLPAPPESCGRRTHCLAAWRRNARRRSHHRAQASIRTLCWRAFRLSPSSRVARRRAANGARVPPFQPTAITGAATYRRPEPPFAQADRRGSAPSKPECMPQHSHRRPPLPIETQLRWLPIGSQRR